MPSKDTYAQLFTVLNVEGEPKIGERIIHRGTQLYLTTAVSFFSPNEKLIAIADNGHMVLLSALSSNFENEKVTLSCKTDGVLRQVSGDPLPENDMMEDLTGRGTSLQPHRKAVFGELSVPLLWPGFESTDFSIFFITYTYRGQKIHKDLQYDGENLLLNSNILTVRGEVIRPEEALNMTLKYIDLTTNKVTNVTKLYLSFVEKERVIHEIKAMVDYCSWLKGQEKYLQLTYLYLQLYYGEPSIPQVETLLQEAVNIQ
ncbi:hypothetical protein GCM10023331_30900 [Algivirga pacifica]|uniref:DUF4369 domain-containing protein n=2 Tax=Algivirga pacifica TaxID=1162670 RepID=A0ABP9DHK7_9BACT